MNTKRQKARVKMLELRRKIKRKKPEFLRQNWFRHPRLGKKWRSPRGIQSKLRRHIKGKGFLPKPGYGSPAAVRGLHPSGLKEVLVYNPDELKKIDNKTDCIRIASEVGRKKRREIIEKAEKLKIKVLNP